MTYNEKLNAYSNVPAFLEKVDGLWEKHRASGDPFLHELSPTLLKTVLGVCAALMTADPSEEVRPEEPAAAGEDWPKAVRSWLEDAKAQLTLKSGDTLTERLPLHVTVRRLEEGVGYMLSALYGVQQFMEEINAERRDVSKVLSEFNQGMEDIAKTHTAPSVLDDTNRAVLYRLELTVKLHNLLLGGVGEATLEELKALSAGLDVAIRARDGRRR